MDLDRLAAAYDHRLAASVRGRMGQVVAATGLERNGLVVDVGGGRGAQAEALIAAAGCRAAVIDPSSAMLSRAAERGVMAVRGRGERLPIVAAAADLVLFHLSIHHGDWHRMLSEAWRVVRPGGAVWVWTMSPEYHRSSHLARWFPRVAVLDAARFPSIGALADAMRLLGGTPAVVTDVQIVERTAGEWIAAVRAGYVSTLHLLSQAEVDEGIQRFSAVHADPAEVIRYELEVVGVWSRRPPVES